MLSALLDEIFDTASHVAARDEILKEPLFIVSIMAGNSAVTALAAIRKSRQIALAATASRRAASGNNIYLSILWREVISLAGGSIPTVCYRTASGAGRHIDGVRNSGQAVRASALGGGIGARSSLRCADDLPMVPVGGNEMQQSPSFSSRRGAAALARQPARVVVPVEIAKGRDRRLVAHGKSESDVGYLFLGALVSAVRPDLLSAGGTVELDARIKLKHLYPARP